MKYIYIYTTETYRLNNWFKIGESINDPLERIKSQDNASNPESLEYVDSWIVPDGLTDKSIHSFLEKSGFNRIRKHREWFELSDTPSDDVESAILNFTKQITHNEKQKIAVFTDIPHYSQLWWFTGKESPTIDNPIT